MSIIKYEYINKNQYTRPGLKLSAVKGIVIHWTANPGASARNHKAYFGNGGGGRYAGCHIFVDTQEALCIVPLDEVTYQANERDCRIPKLKGHSGSYYGDANCTTVGIEMCVEKNGQISQKTIDKAVKVAIELCKKFKLDENDIYTHNQITGKDCPRPFVTDPSKFVAFKKAVKTGLKGGSKVTQVSKPNDDISKKYYTKTFDRLIPLVSMGVYSDKEFKKEINRYNKGTKFDIVGITHTKTGIPRFIIKDKGKTAYVTANRSYVKAYSVSKTYTVAKGDTLSKIAEKNKTTVNKIKKDNNLQSDLIVIGQKLKIK